MERPIVCTQTGMSPGQLRFSPQQEAPKVKSWRCELTALSQLYNLYFVAYNDIIHVFQPSFPDQSISAEPELVLYPPVSSPDLKFGIDPDDPHSITRLIVDYLGHEEVILVTCDDGDVIGYRIEEIQRTVEGRKQSPMGYADGADGSNIRVFLHRNVGASAWGLAIHREARMIAISANTHKVTVLAYALVDRAAELPESDFSDTTLSTTHKNAPGFPSLRTQDHLITLSASTNVPAVSFDNTGKDYYGRWLFSSSVDGKSMLWDLHKPQAPARVFQMGWCASTERPFQAPGTQPGMCMCRNAINFLHGAWGALFLDAHSAHELISSDDLDEETSSVAPYFKDVSDQKKQFVLYENGDAYYESSNHVSEMAISENGSEESDHAEPEDASEQDDIVNQPDSLFVPEGSQPNPQPAITPFSSATAPSLVQPLTTEMAQSIWNNSDDDESDTYDDIYISVAAHAQSLMSLTATTRQPRPYCEIVASPTFQNEPDLRAPCLIMTKEEIFLIQRPLDTAGDYSDPIIAMRRPLHCGHWLPFLQSCDRHCFSTQIPELGIFIVASPIGSAAVFILTKKRKKNSISKSEVQYTYGFRLEYVLPFAKGSERENYNPMISSGIRLIGVAVGPVQGMLDHPGESERNAVRERRWRLLMYHTDHTVLSYEISKRRIGEEPGLGELVV